MLDLLSSCVVFLVLMQIYLPATYTIPTPRCPASEESFPWPTATAEALETAYRQRGTPGVSVTEYTYEGESRSAESLVSVVRRDFGPNGDVIFESQLVGGKYTVRHSMFDDCHRRFYSSVYADDYSLTEQTFYDESGWPVLVERRSNDSLVHRETVSYDYETEMATFVEDVRGDGDVDSMTVFHGADPCSTDTMTHYLEWPFEGRQSRFDTQLCRDNDGFVSEVTSTSFDGATSTSWERGVVHNGLLRYIYRTVDESPAFLLKRFDYDEQGRIESIVVREASGDERLRYLFRYDALGRTIDVKSIWHGILADYHVLEYEP